MGTEAQGVKKLVSQPREGGKDWRAGTDVLGTWIKIQIPQENKWAKPHCSTYLANFNHLLHSIRNHVGVVLKTINVNRENSDSALCGAPLTPTHLPQPT